MATWVDVLLEPVSLDGGAFISEWLYNRQVVAEVDIYTYIYYLSVVFSLRNRFWDSGDAKLLHLILVYLSRLQTPDISCLKNKGHHLLTF
jgi:hypothetical protein